MIKRKSNMELLRIFSILFILIFHCTLKGGFSFTEEYNFNEYMLKLFYMLGELGVNLFVLISGYFMINGRFKWKKAVLLIFQVMFYNTILTLIARKLGLAELGGIKEIFLAFFPVTMNRYWFFNAYLVMYFLSPYLNVFAHAMSKKLYNQFLLVVLMIYSVIPTIFGVFYNNTEGLLYYNRLIWLIIVYFIGAYIKLHSVSIIENLKKSALTTLCASAVMVLSVFTISSFSEFFEALGTTEPAYFWPPNTVPMIVLSVGVFGIFANINIPSNAFINKISSTTLGIYLLHDGVLAYWIWRTVFHISDYQDSPYLILHILLAAAVVFILGVIIDLIRQFIEKFTIIKLLNLKAFSVSGKS